MIIDEGDPSESGTPVLAGRHSSQQYSPEPVSPARLSPDAVQAMYDTYGRDLLTFLLGVLRKPDLAQDVLQTTFQRVLEVGHEARSDTVRGWLFKVAFHEAMACQRNQSRRERLCQSPRDCPEEPIERELPWQSLVRSEELARMKRVLGELPLDQQVVVRKRLQEEKTFSQIADELRVPLGTVLTRMRLAIQKLKSRLEEEA